MGEHCPTCICGRRAPVQADRKHGLGKSHGGPFRGPGTITWTEHLEAWSSYAAQYGSQQSAERLAERGGFGWQELKDLLGHEPKTWEPR